MKKYISFHLLSIVCFALVVTSCSDDTDVGYGLLEDEALEVEYTDEVELIAKTTLSGPIDTYTLGQPTLNSLFLGEVNDPDFGTLKTDVYFSPAIRSTDIQEFTRGVYDSLVLTVRIDSSQSYGSLEAEHMISVHMTSNTIPNDTLNSNQSFEVESQLIGFKGGIIPSLIDSVTVPDGLGDSSFIKIKDIIRIRLNDDLGRTLFQDTTAHQSTTQIREIFPGLRLTDETENSLFYVRNTSYVTLYYHDADGNFMEYIYFLNGGPLTSHIAHDYAGSPIETLLDVPVGASSNLYLQGLAGTDVSIDISAIRSLDDVLINHASIEFFIVDGEGRDTTLFPPVDNVFLLKDSDAGLTSIEDLTIATSFVQDLRHFGGYKEEDTEKNKIKYEMNITTHLIDVLKGIESDIIYLRVANSNTNPSTVVLHGPSHPEFPARLKLTYTKS